MNEIFFRPQWGKTSSILHHTWNSIGNIDQFKWFVRADVQEQLALAHAELGMKHIRAIGMFSSDLKIWGYSPVDAKLPAEKKYKQVNYSIVDYCIDRILDAGIKPMITTCFMPEDFTDGTQKCWGATICPPKNLKQWTEFVGEVLRHFKARYGVAELRSWYFEVWNEPNLQEYFWTGTQAEWFEFYSATRLAIKTVDPSLRVCGPSTARADWLEDFLRFTIRNHCEPEVLATHIYNTDQKKKIYIPFSGPADHQADDSPHYAAGVVRGVKDLADATGFAGEIHWNEWGRSSAPCAPGRETALEAAYIVKTMAEVSQEANQFALWCLSDIYDQCGYPTTEFCDHYGMLSLHSLRKPSYKAHQVLNRLGSYRVPCYGGNIFNGALCTEDGNARRILIYLYPEPGKETMAEQVHVSVDLPGEHGAYPVLLRITAEENNIKEEWRKLGSPQFPTREQIVQLKDLNTLSWTVDSELSVLKSPAGVWTASFTLERPGVAILEL